jgi:hypothetical protein
MENNWITEEKIVLLETDMQKLLVQLRTASQMDETTFGFIQEVRGALAKIAGLHTTLAGWEVLLEAMWGKNR